MQSSWCLVVALSLILNTVAGSVSRRDAPCHKTKVLILGAGEAGITAAQTLSREKVDDFIIVEYNGVIGGRVRHTNFGSNAAGQPYTIELGANWVQGTQTPGGPSNPIWTLAQEYNLTNTYSNYSSILTYNETGFTDYSGLQNDFDNSYGPLEEDAGYILTDNLLDPSARTGLTLAGWTPRTDTGAQAIEYFNWDFEYAYPPEETSELFGIVNYNTTFYQWSEANNYVFDSRGFNAFIIGQANTFLKPNDPRLMLNTVVTNVSYSDKSVVVDTANGTCIEAEYAICTFSVGVLKAAAAGVAPVSFSPDFPRWKQSAVAAFEMATYTKIFLQFEKAFWPQDTQFFLYASPTTRGYYTVWQSLDSPGFLEGSGIIFATVVGPQSARLEAQSDQATMHEAVEVLKHMFGADNVPKPKAFLYPRWGRQDWAYGSYSNWPNGLTLDMHQNLRANLGRLWFAGEGTSAEYFGFLQGAHIEGQDIAQQIAGCLNGTNAACAEPNYSVLHGTTPVGQYNLSNGWTVTSFQTTGDV